MTGTMLGPGRAGPETGRDPARDRAGRGLKLGEERAPTSYM
jgi:hypothetical protein